MEITKLLSNKGSSEMVSNLLKGAEMLKAAKKFFEGIDRSPGFLDQNQKKDMFSFIDEIDVKTYSAIEEVHKTIALVVHYDLDNNINTKN